MVQGGWVGDGLVGWLVGAWSSSSASSHLELSVSAGRSMAQLPVVRVGACPCRWTSTSSCLLLCHGNLCIVAYSITIKWSFNLQQMADIPCDLLT